MERFKNMAGQVSKETREWLSEVLPEVLRDEDIILRLVERGLLWLEWNPTDKNYVVWMSKRGEGDRFAILKEIGVFPLPIAPSRFGGNVGLTHLPEDLLANLGQTPQS
jgi:hypothetical protein